MDNDRGISILIIEDNPGDQFLLHENLINTDLSIDEIIMVETLTEGIKILASQKFSLIFLDLFLNDSRGLESFSELIKINPGIPVIIYSGLADTQIALKAIALGAQDFLIKGDYTLKILEKTIRYSIERKSNQDALEQSNARYTFISKATHDMVWDSNLITGEVYRNPEGWKKIFRAAKPQESGNRKDFNSRIHPDDYEKSMKLFDDIIQSQKQEVFDIEFRIIRDDGSVGWLQDRGYIIRNTEGKAVRLIGASHDITDRKNEEQKTLLREQRFRSLVQNGSDLIGVIGGDGNYIHAGGSIKKATGYDSISLIDKTPFSFIHADDWNIIKTALKDIRTNSFVKIPPYRYINSAGKWCWMQTILTNLLDDPSVNGIIANSRDITESKIAADEIEKLSMVAKNTLSGVFILDTDRRIEWVNDAFTRITEFTSEDAIGERPSELLYGKNSDKEIFKEIKLSISEGIAYEGERLNYTKSGKPVWVWLQLQPLFNTKGEIKQYFAIQTDITEKKAAEDELEKLSLIAKETINGVVIVDNDQKVLWINNAFTKICGYELEEVIGRSPLDFFRGPESDDKMVPYIKEQIKKQQPFFFEKLNYNKAGEKVYMRVQMQPVFNSNGIVKQFFALFTDITVEKGLAEKVELEKIIKQKQITDAVFAAQENERSEIGRELHDNVNQLLGASKLYLDMARTAEQGKDSLLASASTYILSAIEEIRKLSKVLITPLIKEIGLADSIKDLTEEIMLVHPISILFVSENFMEDELSDKFKLNIFRIVQEQINNILKHAKAKTITISVLEADDILSVSIADDGIGFDTNKRKNGVGITNIKSRSELYNGKVTLISLEGEGTTLSIAFNKDGLLSNN